jgi:hypothetical protein
MERAEDDNFSKGVVDVNYLIKAHGLSKIGQNPIIIPDSKSHWIEKLKS